MKRLIVGFLVAVAVCGCERQPLFVEAPPISGYRIEGKVTDRIENPVANANVRLFYDYDYVDSKSPPSKQFTVTDSTKLITVAVRNSSNQTIRILYSGTRSVGPFIVDWNQKDSSGAEVPSSVYSVHYLVDGVSQKSYPVTVSGTVVTKTDNKGWYSIPDENLPVGFYPVPIYSSYDTTYYGNHRINNFVRLVFETPVQNREIFITLTKDRITQVDIVIG